MERESDKFDRTLRRVLTTDAHTLGVERVSYWRFEKSPPSLRCEATYVASSRKYIRTTGPRQSVLLQRDAPEYFRALRDESVVACQQALADTRTRELAKDYLAPLGVKSLMDVPVFIEGKLAGVLCHEHVGTERPWDPDEQHFAVSLGQILSASLEINSRRRAEAALRKSEAELKALAYHDVLTGLPNRVYFQELLEGELVRAQGNPDYRFAVLFLDLDGFKLINDSLGHDAGDELLIAVARRLRGVLGERDVAARLGGDEFTLLVRQRSDAAALTELATRVSAVLRRPLQLSEHEIVPSVSIGIVMCDRMYTHANHVLRDADAAMYRAKERGKARYALYESEMHARTLARLAMGNELRRVIERNELRVLYQPIVRLDQGTLYGFEALLRWRRSDGREVMPDEFIPVAEETKEIHRMGQWVLEQACRQAAQWRELRPDLPLAMAVNLSGVQFADAALPDHVARCLTDTGFCSELLHLEITEGLLADETNAVASMLRRMPGEKCIDDFGTGHSSISRLHHLPVATVKIDRSFLAHAVDSPKVVEAIVRMAHTLNLQVVAEGIETVEQLALMRQLGCEFGQGFLFSRPVSAEVATEMVAGGRLPLPTAG
jgi:diguanylate cyclase (GGDEF)-like protein